MQASHPFIGLVSTAAVLAADSGQSPGWRLHLPQTVREQELEAQLRKSTPPPAS
jgi:hypothetical protein